MSRAKKKGGRGGRGGNHQLSGTETEQGGGGPPLNRQAVLLLTKWWAARSYYNTGTISCEGVGGMDRHRMNRSIRRSLTCQVQLETWPVTGVINTPEDACTFMVLPYAVPRCAARRSRDSATVYPLRIGLIGDVGQTANSTATRDHLLKNSPQVILHMGDNA